MLFDLRKAARVARDARRVEGDAATLTRRSDRRLQAMVDHARTWSRYHAARYADVDRAVRRVEALPVMTKPDLMAHFDDWVTDPAVSLAAVESFTSDLSRLGEPFLGRYFACTTSGVTGRRAILLKDVHEMSVLSGLRLGRLAPTLFASGAIRSILRRGLRVAAVVATGGHFAGAAGVELARRSFAAALGRYRTFSVLAPLPDLTRELNAFRPTAIVGYPTAIKLLADEARAGRLHVRPAYTLTAGEVLTRADRQAIENAFGGVVQQAYAASEALALAFECEEASLHVNKDWYVLEPVDRDLRPVAPGTASYTTLVTNLANRVQPVIRYDLGDSITVAREPCLCGSGLPTIQVEGRKDDVLVLGENVRVLPLALSTVIEETPGVARFQAIQTGPDALRIRIEPAPGSELASVWPVVERRLAAWLATQGVEQASLQLDDEPPARDPRSGKYRQVWREKRTPAPPAAVAR